MRLEQDSVSTERDHASRRSVSRNRREILALVVIVTLAASVRVGVCVARADALDVDVDGYIGLAERLHDGLGYVLPDRDPTAYRPPLYPVVLAVPVAVFGTAVGVVLLNVVCGTATVFVTWGLGLRLGLGLVARVVAAAIVACDPLLVLYTSYAMTETLFTLLTLGLLWALVGLLDRSLETRLHLRFAIATGAVFGLAALCRPTIWAFGLLAVPISLLLIESRRAWTRSFVTVVVTVAVIVSPWVIRNAVVLGRPVLMTTHGGYTVLLGNNPVFEAEVVRQPWGTVWSGESLDRWQQSLEDAMNAEHPPVVGELARDAWHRRRAIAFITDHPQSFLRAAWLRVRRLWSPVPLGSGLPRFVIGCVAVWNVGVMLLAVVGSVRSLSVDDLRRWWPMLVLVVAVTVVHTVYWSNARMRAPLVPVLALLAARVLSSQKRPRGT